MYLTVIVCLVLVLLPLALQAAVIAVPPGGLHLLEVGDYRLAYRRDGAQPVEMGRGWTGHFDEATGISYQPWRPQEGVPTLLIHSPWRGGKPGITYAEYDLRLPQEKPITFKTGVAMATGITDKSDGVTFRVRIAGPVTGCTPFERHVTGSSWQEVTCDLSPLAGQQVLVRLEVDPGPDRDPGFDYSLWGDPRIIVGQEPTAAARLAAVLAQRQRWPAGEATRVLNRQAQAPMPTTGHDGDTFVGRQGGSYVLEWRGKDCRVCYRLPAGNPQPRAFTVQVDDLPAVPLCADEGFELADGRLAKTEMVSAGLAGERLRIVRRCPELGLTATTTVSLSGKTLVLDTTTDQPGAAAWRLGHLGPVALRRPVTVPYLANTPIAYLPDQAVFVSTFLDWTRTNASRHDGATARYGALTDGSRAAVREVGYITASPYLAEVLPSLPYPPSPYRAQLAALPILDIWGGTYDDCAARLREIASYGVEKAAVIHHAWQRGGYDNELPTLLPANADLGGDEGMKRYVATARELGFPLALHENYVDFYPNSELYTEADVARESDGSLMKAWYNAGTKVQSYAYKPTAMLKYAKQFSPEIHRRYGTTANYLDVHSCVPPWFHVDFDAKAPGAGMCRTVVAEQQKLFAFMHEAHGGTPLFGEGNQQMYWAGLVDGVEAQVEGGEFAPTLVDFDLLKLHPQMVNHGMGYYERWMREGYEGNWFTRVPPQARMDRYRTMEVAFGHAGFVGQSVLDKMDYTVKEAYLVGPLQARYGTADPVRIEYEMAGKLVPVEAAVALSDFSRVHVVYEGDFQVWANRSATDWQVDTWTIPPDGYLALGKGFQGGTVRIGGRIADLAEEQDQVYADARSFIRSPVGVRKQIKPTVQSFESLGNRRFRVTYAWQVGEALPGEPLIPFVHFDRPGQKVESILWQQDHQLATPTTQWQAGMTVVDGPYEVEVPADAGESFHWLIGLFSPRVPRLSLIGPSPDGGRITLGTLAVDKDGAVTYTPAPADDQAAKLQAAYEDRMNPKRAMVDFGAVATNGAVAVRRREGKVEIFPVPQGVSCEVRLPLERWGLTGKERVRAFDPQGKEVAVNAAGRVEGGRLVVEVGQAGVARYVIAP